MNQNDFHTDYADELGGIIPSHCSSKFPTLNSDCCSTWTRFSTPLGHIMRTRFLNNVLPEITFHFCPWCGQSRKHNRL